MLKNRSVYRSVDYQKMTPKTEVKPGHKKGVSFSSPLKGGERLNATKRPLIYGVH